MVGVATRSSGSVEERRTLVRWPSHERRALRFDSHDVQLRQITADDAEMHAVAGSVLTAADLAEIDVIGHPALKQRAIASRVLLRRMLSEVHGHGITPSQWAFARTPEGKPGVAAGLPQIYFSISYSGRDIVIAVSRTCEIGIDVESEQVSVDEVCLQPYLTRRERLALTMTPQHQRQQAAVRLWTLKEAYIKLRGIGLAADLSTIEFGFDPIRLSSEWEPADRDARTLFAVWTKSGDSGPLYVSLAVAAPGAVDQRST